MSVERMEFVIDGAPPSVNHMYQQVERYTAEGSYRSVRKADSVSEYQTYAAMVVRLARPKNWLNKYVVGEYIRIEYRFFLKRHIDCDNMMKALNDAIAGALGVDDKYFLPSVRSKSVGKEEVPRVQVTIGPAEE
jgi:Holliday junction resolvase RusA-like endonuclease